MTKVCIFYKQQTLVLTFQFSDLGLAQIYPIWDEDTDEERVAASTSFADPYVAILRDDLSLLLLQTDESGDLDEVSLPEEIASMKWRSVCIYHDKHQIFSQSGASNGLILFAVNLDYQLSVGFFFLSKYMTAY